MTDKRLKEAFGSSAPEHLRWQKEVGAGEQSAGSCLRRVAPWAFAALLIAPSAYWVAVDRSVWSWDPANYGFGAVDLWRAISGSSEPWLRAMERVGYVKAPGIVWLGQFFVPLGAWVGSIETGLLVSVLIAQVAALVLAYRLGVRVSPGDRLAPAVAVLLLGASPLFVSMSHHFLTEGQQLLTIVYVFWVAARAAEWPFARTVIHLGLALALGLIAKFSTPAFVLAPAALAAWRAASAWRRRVPWTQGRAADLAVAVVGSPVIAMGIAWYVRNGARTARFARMAASSDRALDYGRRGAVLEKLLYWIRAVGDAFLAPEIPWLLLGAAVIVGAAWMLRRRPRLPLEARSRDVALMGAAAVQLVIVLGILSRTVNEEIRYLLALGPSLLVLLVGLLSASRRVGSAASAIVALALCGQWMLVNARGLGQVPDPRPSYWSRPPAAQAPLRVELARLVDRTCDATSTGRSVMTGVDFDWVNLYTLTFYSAKTSLRSGFRCRYEYLGHAPKDPAVAWARIEEVDAPYFVSIDARAQPDPPDFLNQVAVPVLRRVEADPRFDRVPFTSESRFLVFRHSPSTVGP